MKNKKAFAFLFLILIFPAATASARWVWSPEAGKFVNDEGEISDTSEELFQAALQSYRDKDLDDAIDQLKSIVKKYPNSKVAPDAQYRMGTIFEEKEDYLKAYEAYKRLIESYPQNRHFDEVIERLFRIGNLFLSGQKAKLFGLEILPSQPRAVEVFGFIVKNAPFGEFGDKAQFQQGLSYKKWGRFADAVQAFQSVIDQYPQSPLIADARYQLAETSFQRSNSEFRDQKALDEAGKEVDRFLSHYTDGETSEKAEKLRQVIDETNAEKNYKIAEYYEKTNYIDSSLIYYADAAERYPETQWGKKAAEKIHALKEPAAYHTTQEQEVIKELQVLEAKLKVTDPADKIERERLEQKIKVLNKREKGMAKEKKDNLDRLKDDLKRRELEMKEKYKNLEKKKKLMKNNQSEDFQKAMARWEASLVTEQEELNKEKARLAEWREDLGVKDGLQLPFTGEPRSEIDTVRGIEAKKLFKLSEERKHLLEEKELLYKQRGELISMLEQVTGKKIQTMTEEEDAILESLAAQDQEVKERREQLKASEAKIESLEKRFDEKRAEFDKKSGGRGWAALYKVPTRVVSDSTQAVVKSVDRSFDFLNPFSGSKSDFDQISVQELAEMEMHMKEKITTQQNLIETLKESFDSELALQEQKRLMEKISTDKEFDAMDLRKDIKKREKAIRAGYQSIEDIDKEKELLLKQLDDLFKEEDKNKSALEKTGRMAALPAVKTGRFFKAFFLGMENKDVALTEAVNEMPQDAAGNEMAQKLKQEIELKSLMIEAKNREIIQLKKELEILQAKASLAGGFKFRSLIVDVPYEFIGEAIDSARRIIPKKERDALLINRLDEETKKLEAMKTEHKKLQDAIQSKSQTEDTDELDTEDDADNVPSAEEAAAPDAAPQMNAELDALKSELDRLSKELEMEQAAYRRQREFLDSKMDALKKQRKETKGQLETMSKEESIKHKNIENLQKDLQAVEKQLQELIKLESELEDKESSILQKRITHIDKLIPQIASKAMSQNLLSEREQMESRLNQLAVRKDFLSKENQRFELAESRAF